MRIRIPTLLMALLLVLPLTGCREEGAAERFGRQVDEAVEGARESASDALDEAGKKVDEAVEDAKDALAK
jgi:hypothetical protein